MEPGNSLINFGEISKPISTIVEKVIEIIRFAFEPYHVKKMAEANAYAEKIRTISNIEIEEIQQRAIARFCNEEAKKQENIENIIKKTLPKITEQAIPENVENDWVVHFFDRCRLISDDTIQELWSKVLSGQINASGKYSKNTINILSSLEKSDVDLFSNLCNFCAKGKPYVPLVYDDGAAIYNNNNITFTTLSHLDSLGLIHYDISGGETVIPIRSERLLVSYFEKNVYLKPFEKLGDKFLAGKVFFTEAGAQLSSLCEPHSIDGFFVYLEEHWKRFYEITIPE